MTEIRNQVKEFHDAMNLPSADRPNIPTNERVKLRLGLITEEYFESLTAATGNDFTELKQAVMALINNSDPSANLDMEDFIDGLGDVDYVVEGTRLEFGVDGGPIAEEIHAANMRKADGPIREDGKKLKPPNWVGPDIKKRLEEQGWKHE